jgi:RNA polymerase sigma-70 factor, ECF subfamily
MFGTEPLNDDVVRAAVQGSADETRRIITALSQQVRTMILARLTGSPAQWHAVDDLAQQALTAILQGLPTLRQATVAGLRSFASSVVSYKVADLLRASAAAPHQSLDSSRQDLSTSAELKDLLAASGLSPLSNLAKADSIRLVMQELGRLPDAQREIITLAFFDHLAVGEIAERLGISRPAASMQLIRAMQALRRAVTGSSRVQDGPINQS